MGTGRRWAPREVFDPVGAEGGGAGVLAGGGVPKFDGAVLPAGGEKQRVSRRLARAFGQGRERASDGLPGEAIGPVRVARELVAFAAVQNGVVVTNEQPAPESKREIKLPDVCVQFGVTYKDTFQMLRELAVRFDYSERSDDRPP